MGSVLLHIAHPERSADLVVADDEPIDALMPSMLSALGLEPDEQCWRLTGSDGSPLAGDRTLGDAAVLTGGTVHLVGEAWHDTPANGASPEDPPPDGVRPPAAAPIADLDAAPVPDPAPPPLPAAPPRPAPIRYTDLASPSQRTARLLPRQRSPGARAGLAARALFRSGADAGSFLEPDPSTGPSPGELTMKRASGPVARVRGMWRDTEYVGRLDRRISQPRLTRCATVAVVSPKGGVGKTTITSLLGTLLARLRHDRIVAIDTNPDYGSLGRTLAPSHRVYVDDLLEVLDYPTLTVTQLDASLARGPHGLLVLPAPTAPDRMARLDRFGYGHVIQKLQKLVSVILLDCGTGLWEPAAQVALASADQVILVSDAEPATASLVAEASHQLRALDVPVTLVVNRVHRGGRLDVERFAQSIRWAQGLVTVADERGAAAVIGTEFEWDRAPRSWRVALRELGALIAGDWERLGLTL